MAPSHFVGLLFTCVVGVRGNACDVEHKLADFWYASGPPLSDGSAQDCSEQGGFLHRVSVDCGDDVFKFLLDYLLHQLGGMKDAERETCQSGLAMRWKHMNGGFQICFPPSCPPDATRAASLLVLSLGHGLLDGASLKLAALNFLSMMREDEELRSDIQQCFSFEDCTSQVEAQTLDLNSGYSMPMVAFGTAGMSKTREAVDEALRLGYRAIDTATSPLGGDGFGYDQHAVGQALLGVDRRSIFVTSKVHPAELGFSKTLMAVERALQELGDGADGYVDLFLIHFPTCELDYCPKGGALRPLGTFEDSWRGLEEAVRRGWVRSIGVSNFDAQQLQRLLSISTITPAVVGVWADIYHPVPRSLRVLCRRHKIQIQVYGTLGYEWSQGRGLTGKLASRSSPLLLNPVLRKIASSKNWPIADVAVKFFLQQRIAVILSSGRRERMVELYCSQDARQLSEEELEQLHDLDGFLASSLKIDASPDFYAGMAGFDTPELHTLTSQFLHIDWDCSGARADFEKYGVVHLQQVLPPVVLQSAQRACQKIVLDHGGGNWEKRDEFPPVLCDWTKSGYNADISIDKVHTTELSYLFPAVVSIQDIAKCILRTEAPVIYYLLLRGKAQGCNASSIPWHQDTAYNLWRATEARVYDEKAEADIETWRNHTAVLHIPLTTETSEKGALMYALGSHEDGLDPQFWSQRWLFGLPLPPYEFNADHSAVKTMETQPGDALVHSTLVHHGTCPNVGTEVRWHMEVGVQHPEYQYLDDEHRIPFPPEPWQI
ncbi:Redox2 [Symbiodinium sp. CCMP2592]|nr:Redox2 [Symbiodinium sp. CCMP2592]